MKIDKIIFAASETFSVFWNLNARVWKTKLGVEPVLLLFGKRENTDVTEEHGRVIEMPILPQFPLLIQITWGKFFHTASEPDTTWLIGDIDLFPLCTYWFIDRIMGIPDDHYVHLDADGITQLSKVPYTWTNDKPLNLVDRGHATNLPGHYHCGKGSTLKTGLELGESFEVELAHIAATARFHGTRAHRVEDPIKQHNMWCAEEHRSTGAVRRSILGGKIKFTGISIPHGIERTTGQRIDRTVYDDRICNYAYNLERLQRGEYVDLHAIRPFRHCMTEERSRERWAATVSVLKHAGMIC